MADPRVRRQIALRAAQLMYAREESEYFTAKRKAARALASSDRARDLPSNAEIRAQILALADLVEGDQRLRDLEAMRLEALFFLRLLERWKPRVIGSVLTGHIRRGSDIDLHAFCDSPSLIADTLAAEGFSCQVERKRVLKHHQERFFTHIHVRGRYPVEITVYPSNKSGYPFKSSITGRVMDRAGAPELEHLLRRTNPHVDLDRSLHGPPGDDDAWALYEALLRPLEHVRQSRAFHPEGDALFHSLQVFDLAAAARPFDQEFMLAALLHDVGKAIDHADHVAAGLDALGDAVTERTAWLIAHHMDAHQYRAGALGARARRRLEQSDDFEDLTLLAELDRAGRVPGAIVPTVEEALARIRAVET